MIPHEGGDHVVRVVVQRLQPHLAGVAGLLCSGREIFWFQLIVKERVRSALVNQDVWLGPGVVFEKFRSVVSLASFHRAKISLEGLNDQLLIKIIQMTINFSQLLTFSPQGTATGLTMGAKAETDLNMPGFLR